MATVAAKTNWANWFEIPVKDLERAVKFYEKAFDTSLVREEMSGMKLAMFPYEEEGRGAGGALIKGKSYVPSHEGAVVYFSVADIDEALRRVGAAGGKTLMPKTGIGQYGFIAHYEDTEGNRLALHAMK